MTTPSSVGAGGGVADATILPLHLAEVSFPEGHPEAGRRGPVLAFAVVHGDAIILFDTGVGTGAPEIDEWFRPTRRPIVEALAAHGLEAADVRAVVNSHLHFDHCGQNALFPGLPIFVQAAEHRAAHAEPDYTIAAWVDFPGARYELLDGGVEILAGVRILPTPGHTPGHQSLVVSTVDGPVVIAGQAVYTHDEWSGSTDRRRSGEPSAWDPRAYADSRAALRGVQPVKVFFSHDEVAWERSAAPTA